MDGVLDFISTNKMKK